MKSNRQDKPHSDRRSFLKDLLFRTLAVGVGGRVLGACGSGRIVEEDACEGVGCSGHGQCVDDGIGLPRCKCDPGYHAEGLQCIEDPKDSCEGVGCSGHGQCSLDGDGKPQCHCDPGYHAEGLECIEDQQDPCEGVGCSGHGHCTVDGNGKPGCNCDPGYHADGLECVPDDACDTVSLRADALANGAVILAGVTLPASTPIADIQANTNSYAGQHLQVEGLVVSLCPWGRNRVTLRDPDGKHLLVAGDFSVDLPAVTNPGRYMVVEGTWSLGFCRRGPHLNLATHGAVVSTQECPVT